MVLDVVRVEKGRWQDDHILIIGHLATLKGDQMKNRNVQIPYPDEFYSPADKSAFVRKVFIGVGALCVSVALVLGVVLCMK